MNKSNITTLQQICVPMRDAISPPRTVTANMDKKKTEMSNNNNTKKVMSEAFAE